MYEIQYSIELLPSTQYPADLLGSNVLVIESAEILLRPTRPASCRRRTRTRRGSAEAQAKEAVEKPEETRDL